MRNDLADIINFIIENNSPDIVHITSNGYLTGNIVEVLNRVREPSRIHVKISIDAFGQEHDRIRGVSGAFDKAECTVEELKKIRREKGIYLGINQTIVSKDALKDHDKLLEWCNKIQVPLHSTFAYKNVAIFNNSKKNIIIPYEKLNVFYGGFDKDEILKFINKELSSIKQISNFIERILKKYYFRVTKSLIKGNGRFPLCSHLKSHFHIFPNGDIPVCYFNSTIVGNLLEVSLPEILDKSSFKRAREWIRSCPGCLAGCELLPNGIFSGDIIRAL